MLKGLFKQGPASSSTEETTSLLHVLSESLTTEERKDAIENLKSKIFEDVSVRTFVSSYGLETLCSTLRSEWKVGEVARSCLECLSALIDPLENQVCDERTILY